MIVNLTAKKLEREVKYNFSSINFPPKIQLREVIIDQKKLKKETKELKKKLKQISGITSLSILTVSQPVLANNGAQGSTLLTKEFMEFFTEIEGLIMYTGIRLPLILGTGVILWGMIFRKRNNEAKEWLIRIIKGFGQILVLPLIFTIIVLIVIFLFGNYDWFVNPFEVMGTN